MKKEMKLKRGSASILARLFECTETKVRNAMKGLDGENNDKIRLTAVKQGLAVTESRITLEEFNQNYS